MYKQKTAGFGIVGDRRFVKRLKEAEARKSRRSSIFSDNRGLLENTESQKDQPDAQSRETKLLKWKAQKDLQRQLEREKQKPVFRIGLPRHKYNSPVFLHQCVPIVKSTEPSAAIPRVTKATAKRIAARETSNGSNGLSNNIKKSVKIRKRSAQRGDAKELTSFAPENHKFKAPEGLPTLKLFGREALNGKTKDPEEPSVYFSPCIVIPAKRERARCEEKLLSIGDDDESSSGTQIEVRDQQIELLKKASCWSVNSRFGEVNFGMPEGEGHANVIRKLDFDSDTCLSDSDSVSDRHASSAKTKDEEQGASSSIIKNSVSMKRVLQKPCRGTLDERLVSQPNKNFMLPGLHEETGTPRRLELTKERQSIRSCVLSAGTEYTMCLETWTVNSVTPRSNRNTQILTGSIPTTSIQFERDFISFDTPEDHSTGGLITGAESTACAKTRSVRPMTRRLNQRTQILTGSDTKIETPSSQLEYDLICLDTPKDQPPRIRQSPRI